ncbi:MAG: nitroreductase family protein [Mobilitalea sp.]
MIDDNQVIKCIKERRSIRKYKTEQITEDELEIILEAGLYAPNAGGRQSPVFIVTQDKDLNDKIGRMKREVIGEIPAGRHVSKVHPSILDDTALPSCFYGAPTVITLIAPDNFFFSESDCAIAAESMMLAAWSIGVASCYIGKADETFKTEFGKELLAKWKINDHYKAFCHVLFGYADGEIPRAKPRTEGRILNR